MLSVAVKYRSFNSVEALNEVVKQVKQRISKYIAKSVIKLLDFLSSHSLVVKGVSWAGKDYILDHTGMSKATYHRSIKLLEALGVIKVHHWKRHPIIQIQPDIDWAKVDAVLFGESENETSNETEPNADKPKQENALTVAKRVGKKIQSLSISFENSVYEWKKRKYGEVGETFPFYNWLEKD